MSRDDWKRVAAAQDGLITRAQLAVVGVDRWAVRHRVDSGRWTELTPKVIATFTGGISREQTMWTGVLHGGPDAQVGDLAAAEVQGLRNWQRDVITVLVPHNPNVGKGYPGIDFRPVRRPLADLRRRVRGLPVCRLEPAVLLFASRQANQRTADGVLAAVVQQRLTEPGLVVEWIDRLAPLRGAARFRRTMELVSGGAHSVAEIDVRRMCKQFGLSLPRRQVRRRDASGRIRYTDCEWRLPDGRTLVLLRDGKFYADPGSDPHRYAWAERARTARAAGVARADFQFTHRLTRAKANEAWKDADVLFSLTADSARD